MFKWNYMYSALNSTAVFDSLIAYFLEPNSRNLCIAKGERIEIYKLLKSELKLELEIPLNSQICSMVKLSQPNKGQDSLLILTYNRRLLHIHFEGSCKVLSSVAIKQKTNKDENFKILANFQENLVCVYVEQSYFTFINISQGMVGEIFCAGHLDFKVIDFCFVQKRPQFVVLYCKAEKKFLIQIYEINLVERNLVDNQESFPFEDQPSKIITPKNSGVIVLCCDYFIEFNTANTEYKTISYNLNLITAICEIDSTR